MWRLSSSDALNRMTQVAHTLAASTLTYTWTYDQSGPGFANGIGRLTSTTHPSGSTQLSYDALGRITVSVASRPS